MAGFFQLVGWRVWRFTYPHAVFTTYQLTSFMNPFSYWETKRRSASEIIVCLLRNSEGPCRVYKSPPLAVSSTRWIHSISSHSSSLWKGKFPTYSIKPYEYINLFLRSEINVNFSRPFLIVTFQLRLSVPRGLYPSEFLVSIFQDLLSGSCVLHIPTISDHSILASWYLLQRFT
jgi:hypothetical protein